MNKVRAWSSFIEGSGGESDESDVENTSSVSESSSEENTTIIVVSSCEEDSEYFSHKSIITQSIEYITAIYILATMNFIYS